MKQAVKKWIFIKDSFGPIPILSLQHPVRGTTSKKTALVIPADLIYKKKQPSWLSILLRCEQICEQFAYEFKDGDTPDVNYCVYLDGTLTYKSGKQVNKIQHVDINRIYIEEA